MVLFGSDRFHLSLFILFFGRRSVTIDNIFLFGPGRRGEKPKSCIPTSICYVEYRQTEESLLSGNVPNFLNLNEGMVAFLVPALDDEDVVGMVVGAS